MGFHSLANFAAVVGLYNCVDFVALYITVSETLDLTLWHYCDTKHQTRDNALMPLFSCSYFFVVMVPWLLLIYLMSSCDLAGGTERESSQLVAGFW